MIRDAVIAGFALAEAQATPDSTVYIQHAADTIRALVQDDTVTAQPTANALTTAPVIGTLYHADESRLYNTISRLAGDDATAQASALAAGYAIALTFNGVHVPEYVPRIMTFCDGLSDAFDLAMLRIGHVLGWTDEPASIKHIGKPAQPENVVAVALYAMLRYEDDFNACVALASTHSPVTACIAGAIMGARLGSVDALPGQASVNASAFGL